MVNNISDPAVRTENLQRMLRELSLILDEPDIFVNVNGAYNSETRDAVTKYQKSRGLPVTGVVDFQTWSAVSDEHMGEKDRLTEIIIYPTMHSSGKEDFMSFGERSDAVLFLQIMLNALSVSHGFQFIPISGVYGPQTAEAVRIFQKANGIPVDGLAGRRTWRRLAEEYNGMRW